MANPVAATAQWLLSSLGNQAPVPMPAAAVGQPGPNLNKPPPTPADFRIPANLVEHNLVVSNLVAAGSQRAEAEATIASRKTAYNKALRDYKKVAGLNQKQIQTQARKSSRTSKQQSSQSTDNGSTN